MATINGTIARLVLDKGFGFIKCPGVDAEYFFHRSAIEGVAFETLREGHEVTFNEEANTGKGPRATRVKVVD